jgi:hypothetical protein
MKRFFMASAVLSALILVGMTVTISGVQPTAAQSQPKASSYKAPRTVEGTPDLQGIWEVRSSVDADVSKFVIDGPIPYRPEAKTKKDENARNAKTADPLNKCFMAGVPRTMYIHHPFQIFQGAGYFLIASEYAHTFRYIRTDGSPHLEGAEFWMGDPRGHWEGETLVVDVKSFTDQTWFDASGNFHSGDLHVIEKYTRSSPNTITYEATIDDPKTYTKKWTIRVPMTLHEEKNFQIREFECYGF